jgi:hypothetical protein
MDDLIGRLGAANGTDRAAEEAVGIATGDLTGRARAVMRAELARHAFDSARQRFSLSSIEFSVRRAPARCGRTMPATETFDDARAPSMACAAGGIAGAVERLPHQI